LEIVSRKVRIASSEPSGNIAKQLTPTDAENLSLMVHFIYTKLACAIPLARQPTIQWPYAWNAGLRI
jgi:hypothetical protein